MNPTSSKLQEERDVPVNLEREIQVGGLQWRFRRTSFPAAADGQAPIKFHSKSHPGRSNQLELINSISLSSSLNLQLCQLILI